MTEFSIENSPVLNLILDAGPLLSLAPLRGLAQTYITTPAVIAELRDAAVREHFQKLELTQGIRVEITNPTAEFIISIREWAKHTGDIAVLSDTDLGILALTLQTEVTANGWTRIRRRPGEPLPARAPKDTTPVRLEDKLVTTLKGLDLGESNPTEIQENQAGDEMKSPTYEARDPAADIIESNSEVDPIKRASALDSLEDALSDNQAAELLQNAQNGNERDGEPQGKVDSDGEIHWPSESSDDGEWITPTNVSAHMSKDLHLLPEDGKKSTSKKPPSIMKAACMTADYAMQNVALQIGLNLVGTGGRRIAQVKSWVLRCHACYRLCKDPSKKFCPSCGNPTLLRTSVTTTAPTPANPNGTIKIHLKKNFVYRNRGTVYSIPAPKPGKSSGAIASGSGIILREDDKTFQKGVASARSKVAKQERELAKAVGHGSGFGGWHDPDWAPGLMGSAAKGPSGDAVQKRATSAVFTTAMEDLPSFGYGKRNPNERKHRKR